jgi:mannose-6-phosphate isomerase-like protein (cupin superfamily)
MFTYIMGRKSMSQTHARNLLTLDSPVLAADDRPATRLQALGVKFMIAGAQTGGAFAIVEHPMGPLSLAAPYHTHSREDEYSIVLEGEVGFALDDKVIVGRPGDTIFKPRDVRHTFWNATNQPARILEIITPAGFEDYFAEVGAVFAKEGPPDVAALGAIASSYGLDLERETIPGLIERFGLKP